MTPTAALVSTATETKPHAAGTARVKHAAAEFEGFFLQEMLRSVRESTDSGDEDDSSSAVMDTAEQQFAQVLALQGGLGIGKMVLSGIEPHSANANR